MGKIEGRAGRGEQLEGGEEEEKNVTQAPTGDDELRKFEENMNKYLNSPENLPALVKEDASARLERQSSSDLQSQNSKLYPRMSMPQFLQQMQDGAEKNGLNA